MVHPKHVSTLLVAGLILLAPSAAAQAAVRPPVVSAKGAILIDGTTGQVLWGRDTRGEFYPASITKIMTAYLAITHGWHKTVVVSTAAELQHGASAYLLAGQRLPMPKVVTAMMLVSGNDAAYAVAQTVAGSVPAFVRMMNAQARAWGAPGIRFQNPDGLPNPGHVVTALGMAIIARHAMANPIFARIVATKKSTLPPDPHPRIYYNQNQLLYNVPGAVGVKIGYTVEADETIVGAARRHGMLLIEVLLHDTPSGLWPDAASLLNWGFQHYRPYTLVHQGQRLGSVQEGGRRVPVRAATSLPYLVPFGPAPRGRFAVTAAHPRSGALVRRGAIVGVAQISLGGHNVGQVPLQAAARVAPLPPRVRLQWWWLGLPGLVAATLLRRPRRGANLAVRRRRFDHG